MDIKGSTRTQEINIGKAIRTAYAAKGKDIKPGVFPSTVNWSREWQKKGRNFFHNGGDLEEFKSKYESSDEGLKISKVQYDSFINGYETGKKSYDIGHSDAIEWKNKNKNLNDYYDLIAEKKKNPDDCYLKGFEDYFKELSPAPLNKKK